MKLVVGTFLTLDGVMQAPGGPEEDRSGGFEHGGWLVPWVDEAFLQCMVEWCARAGALLLGRRTWEIFAAHWPHVTDAADQIAATFNRVPKYVASRTLTKLAWRNSKLLDGDAAQAVAALKRQAGGELHVHGSGGLLQTLFAHDLVDELRLWTVPLALGTGKRLFGPGTAPAAFELVETWSTGKGATLHVYRRSGTVGYGSFQLAPPSAEEIERRRRIAGGG